MKNEMNRRADSDYPPEFKLRIVMQLMKNPRRKRKICKENNLDEKVVEKWRQQFLERSTALFSEETSAQTDNVQKRSITTPDPLPSAAEPTKRELRSHAVRFNRYYMRTSKKELEMDLPTWVKPNDREEWVKPGVVFWDESTRKIERLSAVQALGIMDFLKATNEWRSYGFKFKYPIILISLDESVRVNKRKGQVQDSKMKSERGRDYETVQVRPVVAGELFEVLKLNETELREMAAREAGLYPF